MIFDIKDLKKMGFQEVKELLESQADVIKTLNQRSNRIKTEIKSAIDLNSNWSNEYNEEGDQIRFNLYEGVCVGLRKSLSIIERVSINKKD